ncbi:MAG: basic amino acid ABC transporter substrate-binding protein [Clostridia bacterium]|nr:basic amino acid ABC transporter substrate-binding protein [Clostridia bacterium]
MKKLVKIISAVLALTFVFAFASCNKNKDGKSQSVKTVKNGVLTMGTNATFPPYEYHEGGEIIGIDAEIAKAIADKLGLELEIKDMEFATLISALEANQIDIVAAGMTVTPDRENKVLFSDSYAAGIQSIIVMENSPVKTSDDLKGKLIGVQESTTGDIYATDDFGDASIKRFNKGTDAVSALKNGQVQAVIIDKEPAKNYVQANPGTKILPADYANEDYAIAIAKSNPELKEQVNKALKELEADGTLQKIIDKYIK